METFNLSQSYPTQDIRKRTSFLTIGLSICLLAAGISLFFLPESTSESNINALKIAAGSLLAVISFYFLIFRARYQAYAGTGSMVCKKSLTFSKEQFQGLKKYLAAMSREEPQLYLLIVHSKDNQYAAFQLLTYSSFLYKPVTELCCLKGEKASTFIKNLHTSHGFLH